VDPHHFNAVIPLFSLMRVRILSRVMQIHIPPWLHFDPLQFLNFDPAFHSNAVPDSGSQNNTVPYGSGSSTLVVNQKRLSENTLNQLPLYAPFPYSGLYLAAHI
jgi:hypothetical protein